MIATKVKDLTGFTGNAALYRLDPPMDGNALVAVSATHVPSSGPETYIFPANEDGEVIGWLELSGSRRGTLDIEGVLREAGYEIA